MQHRNKNGKYAKKMHWFLKIIIVTPFFLGSWALHQVATGEKTLVFENPKLTAEREWDPCGLKEVVCEGEKAPEPQYEVAEVTGYTASVEETDSDPRIAANNREVFKGGIACPGWIKLGQKVEVKGMGVFECNDRMGKRFRDGKYFDIYFETKEEAIAHGRRSMEFRIL